MSFFLCTENGCNKKYKTRGKFEKHLINVHEKIADPNYEPVEITKDNRKTVESIRNNEAEKKTADAKKEALLRKNALEEETKIAFEKAEQERFITIQKEKLRLQEEAVQKLAELQELQNLCLQRAKESEECCMCLVAPRDTCIVPCGHKYFCNPCIVNYHTLNPRKGCPICRSEIVIISRVYE